MLIVAALVLCIGTQAMFGFVKFINAREAWQRAEAWLNEAQRDAKPAMTPDDAIRWLKDQGITKAVKSATIATNEVITDYRAVVGYRRMSHQSVWSNPMTAQLIFHFDANWRFTKLELEVLNYEVSFAD